MKAKLKGIYSIDLPEGKSSLPEDPENCWIVLQADIGLDDGTEAADTFTFYICTPKKLATIVIDEKYQLGRHLIVVDRFEWQLIESIVLKICSEAIGEDWEGIAKYISRFGHWEFEDYNETD
jgi:hypothetical protein